MPKLFPLAWAQRPVTTFAAVSANSSLYPSRRIQTVIHKVSTGALLIGTTKFCAFFLAKVADNFAGLRISFAFLSVTVFFALGFFMTRTAPSDLVLRLLALGLALTILHLGWLAQQGDDLMRFE